MGSISLTSAGVIATSPLFSDLTLTIAEGDRVGLVAGNGGGKTTLLCCIAGTQELTSGAIVRSRRLRVGFVEQDVPARLHVMSFRDAVLDALPADTRDSDSWRAEVVLDEFEAPDAAREQSVATLSGGWQRLMLIARVWINEPDALLLDEPTNHLDLGKIVQLERWLKAATKNMPSRLMMRWSCITTQAAFRCTWPAPPPITTASVVVVRNASRKKTAQPIQ